MAQRRGKNNIPQKRPSTPVFFRIFKPYVSNASSTYNRKKWRERRHVKVENYD